MTTWKDGGDYGVLYREIVSEDGSHAICRVKVRQPPHHAKFIDRKELMPYPQGEKDYRLILQAPRMLEALENIQRQAEYMLETIDSFVDSTNWEIVRNHTVAAIAAVKRDNSDEETELA